MLLRVNRKHSLRSLKARESAESQKKEEETKSHQRRESKCRHENCKWQLESPQQRERRLQADAARNRWDQLKNVIPRARKIGDVISGHAHT